MTDIFTSRGLTLPFKDSANHDLVQERWSKTTLVDLSSFVYIHLKATKTVDQQITKGEVLAYDLHFPDRKYISPLSGKIIDIRRGHRRRISGIVIENSEEKSAAANPIKITDDKEALMKLLFERGLSFFIHKRPFHRIIKITDFPRSIFINTTVSAPYTPSYKHILKGNEKKFEAGINILSKFATVHLVQNEQEFSEFASCTTHSAKGPHPIESPSIHIAAIDPITSPDDVVWSLDVYDVLTIGSLFYNGSIFIDNILSLSGSGFLDEDRILIKTSKGCNISDICPAGSNTISGDPLTGSANEDHLREKDHVITAFIGNPKAELLSFVKPGIKKFTATRTYLGGFFKRWTDPPEYSLGGEIRPFILKDLYQKSFPINIYIEPLIKALLANDYDLAISLGFLDIDTKDLALSEFLCPSKITLMQYFEDGKNRYLLLQEEN